MAKDFTHLVLTKFNILTSPKYGPPERRLTDEWLERRLAEFETFSLPSLRSQTEQGFSWLVFCDAQSPAWFKRRMSERSGVFEPVWVESITNATMGTVLRDRGYTTDLPLITTRVDNDDALSRDFVEAVQSLYAGQDRLYINFPWGLRVCDGGLFRGYWRSNPFMSLIEQPGHPEGFRGVYSIQHQNVHKTETVRNVVRPATWMRSIHSANTVKTQVGWPLAHDRSDRFAIDWDRLPAPPTFSRKVAISADGYRARLNRSGKYRAAVSALTGRAPGSPGW
ncbi:glycosyltransferase [Microbacterium sp. 2P01SA-2]|uniref:glycosyltransferase n=1 Tax=unclassified Microbacterium TaxID=2609290 RepID=UPI0039A20C45